MQLGDAFKNFFAGRGKYPKFRRKGVDDRFTLTNDQFKVKGRKLHIPRLGKVEMKEELRFKGKITSATISRKADRWFVSLTVELQDLSHLKPAENQGVVVPRRRFAPIGDTTIGVDLGVLALATLSTGEVVEGPKPLKRLLRKVRRLSKSVARKEKGSANRQKAKIKLAKTHAEVANIRKDALHKLTTDLTSRFPTIVIEDLNVSGMVKNRKLSRAISDMGFYEFRRQLTYKAAMRGGEVVVADRFFPSSKLCSVCGSKLEELSLSVRKWTCPSCGTCHDRDVNAALNLQNLGKSTASSAA